MRSNTKKEKENTNEYPNVKNPIKKVLMRKKKKLMFLQYINLPHVYFGDLAIHKSHWTKT